MIRFDANNPWNVVDGDSFIELVATVRAHAFGGHDCTCDTCVFSSLIPVILDADGVEPVR